VGRERGFSVNPWSTHTRFLISHRLLIDEAYAGPLRDHLGTFRSGSMLILDEAPGRDALIGGLVDQGFLEKHPSDYQQIWKLGASALSLSATAAERQALEETKAIFQKSIVAGDNLASCKEGVTDAKPGLVSFA
jgi:hypothetical protein